VGGILGETMPTIAQILAAKKAASNATPPGKPPARSLVLSAKQAEEDAPKNDLDHGYPPNWLIEPRSLSATSGEAIPMTPPNARGEVATWHEALNSFESSLCVMRDPKEPEVVWLAVRAERAGLPPILLHRLPWLLWDHPAAQADPF